jgi:hypothetical protein
MRRLQLGKNIARAISFWDLGKLTPKILQRKVLTPEGTLAWVKSFCSS